MPSGKLSTTVTLVRVEAAPGGLVKSICNTEGWPPVICTVWNDLLMPTEPAILVSDAVAAVDVCAPSAVVTAPAARL